MFRTFVLLGILLPLLPGQALAEAIDFQIVPKVFAGGKERPRITIHAHEPLTEVEIELARPDGKAMHFRTGKMKPGASRTFLLELPPGPQRLKGRLVLTQNGGKQESPLDFEAEAVRPAELTLDRSRLDLPNRTLVLSSTRPTATVDVTVTGDDGRMLGESRLGFDGSRAGEPLEVKWRQEEGTPLRIALKVTDPDGMWVGLELFPWSIVIPHEEVTFASGSFRLAPEELPKLRASATQIKEALALYGRWAELRLYIAGHTDTVGPAEGNQQLSLQRARVISEQLRGLGVRAAIFYEGFGEKALAVSTPDETDEVRNRRAEYIVAIEEPTIAGSGHQPTWRRLK